jgi:HNH endonuclease
MANRFWAKVDKYGPTPKRSPELGPCWLWQAAIDKRGYGRFGIGAFKNCRVFFAHRVAFFLSGNDMPDHLMCCHRCDNPACCNPSHLFTGTHNDNMADMTLKGRNKDEACGNGHLWTPENTHIYHWGGYDLRRCRACERERSTRRRRAA